MVEASPTPLRAVPAFQQCQIMQRFVMKLLFTTVAFVSGNQSILEDQTHFINGPNDRDLPMCILRWHRVTVPVKANQLQ